MAEYTSTITCNCGAEYERGEVRLPIRDVGVHECGHCGIVLERWHGRIVPIFRLAHMPKPKNADAA